MSKRFTEKLKTSEAHNVFLSRGTHNGRATWHYIKVEKNKLPLFKKALEKDSIELADFGEILFSGWGESPPDNITKQVKKMFGCD